MLGHIPDVLCLRQVEMPEVEGADLHVHGHLLRSSENKEERNEKQGGAWSEDTHAGMHKVILGLPVNHLRSRRHDLDGRNIAMRVTAGIHASSDQGE
jgi:hypothetical protein